MSGKCRVSLGSIQRTTEFNEFSAEDEPPLYALVELQKTSKAIGVADNNFDVFINIDVNLIVEDDHYLNCADYTQDETANIADDCNEETETNCNQSSNVTDYKQAICFVNDLQEFSKKKGDSSTIETLSDLQLHF